ncbi:hypothetical protein CLIM01_08990 [Colletotrichum limetticola]|nr:hypothetical protein CLIM01_08990 [Colletotrichum limetticola]
MANPPGKKYFCMACHKKQKQEAKFPRSRSQPKPRHRERKVGTVMSAGDLYRYLPLDPNESNRSTKPCQCLSTLWRRDWVYPLVFPLIPCHVPRPAHLLSTTQQLQLVSKSMSPFILLFSSFSSTTVYTPMHVKLVGSPASCQGSVDKKAMPPIRELQYARAIQKKNQIDLVLPTLPNSLCRVMTRGYIGTIAALQENPNHSFRSHLLI